MSLKKTYIRDVAMGKPVQDLFVLAEARQAQSKNGPYWSLSLQDASGRLEAKVWSPLAARFTDLAPGQCVLVRGTPERYRDKPQLVVEALEVVEGELEPADAAALYPTSSVAPEQLLEDLSALLKTELRHKPWRSLTARVLADPEVRARLLAAPGAKSIHHAYAGGLLEHTLAVCRLALAICALYPDIDREIVLVGAAFHDLGKAWELSSGLVQDYTDAGRLIGHIQLGLEVVEPFVARTKGLEPELAMHLKHMILAHHGELEFGSPKRPKTAEAMVLHYADMIDSKLNTVAGIWSEEAGPGCWSGFVRSLDRFLYKPAATPRAEPEAKVHRNQADQLCLLPLKA